MKELIINSKTHGVKKVLLDDNDYKKYSKFKWYVIEGVDTFYVVRTIRTAENPKKRLWLHREIMNPPEDMDVDHKNCDGLDNRRNNLRIGTRTQNSANRRAKKNGKSKYLGVNLQSSGNGRWLYWAANIRVATKLKWLGQFPHTNQGEIAAAKRYDDAAKKYHGEFARLNFK